MDAEELFTVRRGALLEGEGVGTGEPRALGDDPASPILARPWGLFTVLSS